MVFLSWFTKNSWFWIKLYWSCEPSCLEISRSSHRNSPKRDDIWQWAALSFWSKPSLIKCHFKNYWMILRLILVTFLCVDAQSLWQANIEMIFELMVWNPISLIVISANLFEISVSHRIRSPKDVSMRRLDMWLKYLIWLFVANLTKPNEKFSDS